MNACGGMQLAMAAISANGDSYAGWDEDHADEGKALAKVSCVSCVRHPTYVGHDTWR
jgi:hypothetical protein